MSNRSYGDLGAFQINPLGSNTKNRSFVSDGAMQPQKITASAQTLVWVQQTAANMSRQFAMIRTGQ